MENGTDPVTDDEFLYRRVPVDWCSRSTGLSDQAFAPHRTNDVTGLSVVRAKYKSSEEAAKGQPGRSYYVAVLAVADLKRHGIDVVAVGEPGHAELPDLNRDNRKTEKTLQLQRLLVKMCLRVEGPFGPFEQ